MVYTMAWPDAQPEKKIRKWRMLYRQHLKQDLFDMAFLFSVLVYSPTSNFFSFINVPCSHITTHFNWYI